MRTLVLAAAALTLGGACLGCGPRWKVIQQSGPPSALFGVKSYAVGASYDGLSVGGGSEAAHLADKDAESRAQWEADKRGMQDELLAGLRLEARDYSFEEGAEGAEGELEVEWVFVEPGMFSYVLNLPTHVTARLAFKVGGEVVDRIEIRQSENATAFNASSGGRMRSCARRIGVIGGKFVNHVNEPPK